MKEWRNQPDRLAFDLADSERARMYQDLWEEATLEVRELHAREGEAALRTIGEEYDHYSTRDFLKARGFSEAAHRSPRLARTLDDSRQVTDDWDDLPGPTVSAGDRSLTVVHAPTWIRSPSERAVNRFAGSASVVVVEEYTIGGAGIDDSPAQAGLAHEKGVLVRHPEVGRRRGQVDLWSDRPALIAPSDGEKLAFQCDVSLRDHVRELHTGGFHAIVVRSGLAR